MIDSYSVRMNNLEKQKNKFEQMGFVKFWLVSSIFFITFPFSLIYLLVFLGPYQTKEFILVLIKDYIQTLIIIFISLIVVIYFLYNYIISFFS
jgi:hypothetical protein